MYMYMYISSAATGTRHDVIHSHTQIAVVGGVRCTCCMGEGRFIQNSSIVIVVQQVHLYREREWQLTNCAL